MAKIKGEDIFLECVVHIVCISTVFIKCVSHKGKKLTT